MGVIYFTKNMTSDVLNQFFRVIPRHLPKSNTQSTALKVLVNGVKRLRMARFVLDCINYEFFLCAIKYLEIDPKMNRRNSPKTLKSVRTNSEIYQIRFGELNKAQGAVFVKDHSELTPPRSL